MKLKLDNFSIVNDTNHGWMKGEEFRFGENEISDNNGKSIFIH